MQQQNALAEPDLRIWMYRANPDHPDGVEGVIFKSPAFVPEGQGWVDTPAKVKPKYTNGEGQIRSEVHAVTERDREAEGLVRVPKKFITGLEPQPPVLRYRASNKHPGGFEARNFETLDQVPPGWVDDPEKLIPPDLRVWAYRENPAHPNGVEGVIFESPNHVPEGEGWVNTPAKLTIKHEDQDNGERASEAAREQDRDEEGAPACRTSERRSGRPELDARKVRRLEPATEAPAKSRREKLGQIRDPEGAGEGGSARPEGSISQTESGTRLDRRGELEAQPQASGGDRCGEREAAPGRILNFEGLSKSALVDIARQVGLSVSKNWTRARIEEILRGAG